MGRFATGPWPRSSTGYYRDRDWHAGVFNPGEGCFEFFEPVIWGAGKRSSDSGGGLDTLDCGCGRSLLYPSEARGESRPDCCASTGVIARRACFHLLALRIAGIDPTHCSSPAPPPGRKHYGVLRGPSQTGRGKSDGVGALCARIPDASMNEKDHSLRTVG